MELHAEKIGYIDVKIEGLNGQLPNLDLVNLVHRMCSKEGIRHTFKNRVSIHILNFSTSLMSNYDYCLLQNQD